MTRLRSVIMFCLSLAVSALVHGAPSSAVISDLSFSIRLQWGGQELVLQGQ